MLKIREESKYKSYKTCESTTTHSRKNNNTKRNKHNNSKRNINSNSYSKKPISSTSYPNSNKPNNNNIYNKTSE